MRLDVFLVNNKYCESRNKASALISDGNVSVNGKIVRKCAFNVSDMDLVSVNQNIQQFVARSAYKLLTAINSFGLDFQNKTVVDLGASTGGFCQVMLQNGASKIYAVDIGSNQLHPEILKDERIVNMENTDARNIRADMFFESISLITADLSFISLTHVIPAVFKTLSPNGEFICLVKPQFEVGPKNVAKNGVVRDLKLHAKAIQTVTDVAYDTGFAVKYITFSGLAGEAGNKEYLVYMVKEQSIKPFSHDLIYKIVLG